MYTQWSMDSSNRRDEKRQWRQKITRRTSWTMDYAVCALVQRGYKQLILRIHLSSVFYWRWSCTISHNGHMVTRLLYCCVCSLFAPSRWLEADPNIGIVLVTCNTFPILCAVKPNYSILSHLSLTIGMQTAHVVRRLLCPQNPFVLTEDAFNGDTHIIQLCEVTERNRTIFLKPFTFTDAKYKYVLSCYF